MRDYIIIGLIAVGFGVVVGASAGFIYGVGATMLLGGVLELFHRLGNAMFN